MLKAITKNGTRCKKGKDGAENYSEIWKGLKKEHGHQNIRSID